MFYEYICTYYILTRVRSRFKFTKNITFLMVLLTILTRDMCFWSMHRLKFKSWKDSNTYLPCLWEDIIINNIQKWATQLIVGSKRERVHILNSDTLGFFYFLKSHTWRILFLVPFSRFHPLWFVQNLDSLVDLADRNCCLIFILDSWSSKIKAPWCNETILSLIFFHWKTCIRMTHSKTSHILNNDFETYYKRSLL